MLRITQIFRQYEFKISCEYRKIRHLAFYNKDFLDKHPEIVPNRKTVSPDQDKSVHDARLLIPTLQDFFLAHPLIDPKTFLGDAAFDSIHLYESLLSGDTFGPHRHFDMAYIPLNERSKLKIQTSQSTRTAFPIVLMIPASQ